MPTNDRENEEGRQAAGATASDYRSGFDDASSLDEDGFDEAEFEDEEPRGPSLTVMLRLALAALLIAAVAVGLTVLLNTDDGSAPGDDRPVSTIQATACRGIPSDAALGQAYERSIRVGGDVRTYRVYIPRGFDASRPAPVVLNYHGYAGDARAQEAVSGLVPIADREGFLLVSPQGAGDPPNWTAIVQALSQSSDREFFDRMLDALAQELCVDQDRIYATGFSMGGFFAARLACVRNDRLAAIAPVAGLYRPASEACGSRPIPILAFHGSADETVPFGGGRILDRIVYPGVVPMLAAWGQADGCSGLVSEPIAPGVVRASFQQCPVPLELIAIEGLDHRWPGDVGGQPAAERIWRFFSEQRRGQ
jgi:polyhydroxybutyrate depolymerase